MKYIFKILNHFSINNFITAWLILLSTLFYVFIYLTLPLISLLWDFKFRKFKNSSFAKELKKEIVNPEFQTISEFWRKLN